MELANLFAYSRSEKTVRCTVLRVWSPQSENPAFSAKRDCILITDTISFIFAIKVLQELLLKDSVKYPKRLKKL